jgi:arsenate reductase (thioredoxin)
MPSVLFVCVGNAGRSQMAEGFALALAGDGWTIASAGSRPAGKVSSMAVALMREVGIDLTTHRSKGLDALPALTWDVVVTMGCGDACPSLPARRREDWDLPDPKGLPLDQFRDIRDEIRRRVSDLIQAISGSDPNR